MVPNLVFLVGAPRSGTTWLQLLLAQHPGVATSHETQLFSQYLSRLERRYAYEKECRAAGIRRTGLSRLVDDDAFRALNRTFAEQVWQIVQRAKPGAAIVLEKSPDHVFHGDLILALFPDAGFIHLIRDPRGVVNSFRHAADSWWDVPAAGPVAAARYWRRAVEAGRGLGRQTDRYAEVRYEALSAAGEATLAGLLDWLGLSTDEAFCREAVSACAIERLREADPAIESPWELGEEHQGFFRRGETDSWREEMSPAAIRVVEHIASGLMEELGYARVGSPRSSPPWRLWAHDLLEAGRGRASALASAVDRRARRFLSRL